jgi:DNA-directed RNA polymerase subunit M/transcription elongation factor TFIIS
LVKNKKFPMSEDDEFFAQFAKESPKKSKQAQQLLDMLPDSSQKCNKCQKNRVTDIPAVLRRSDEPGCNIYRCEICGQFWSKK